MFLSPSRRGARLARRLVLGRLVAWGFPRTAPVVEAAVAVTAELAAIAIGHGRTPGRDFRLTLTLHPAADRVRVAVCDTRPDRLPPHPGMLGAPAADAEGGRGLLLVEALATAEGWTADDPVVKTVWAELRVGGTPTRAG
ncbi:ATP-binding protein [Streptomyces xantholiticus]|uniref:ATP-binding protein n=1 Tax=Streptomyces xantholiticus TaxID=68285 RepID=A0ABV1UUW4_9ACTN